MSVRIRHLQCRVTVKSGRAETALHKDDKPMRPTLSFAMPIAQPKSESGPEPGEIAAETTGEASGQSSDSMARGADARAVADRVYELMKQEVTLGRLREGRR